MGVVNLAENKYKEAAEAFRRSQELNPANPRGLMGVVETEMAQKPAGSGAAVAARGSRQGSRQPGPTARDRQHRGPVGQV